MLSMNLSGWKNTMIVDKINQKSKLDARATIKPRRIVEAKTTRNNPDKAIAIGNIVVADDAISGD